jgi:hypothetical protein
MPKNQVITRRAAGAAATGLSALMLAACTATKAAPVTADAHPNPVVTTAGAAATPSATPATTAPPTGAATSPAAPPTPRPTRAVTSIPRCGNGDLRIAFGYGGMGDPLQASAVTFTNIGKHTCTLQGYPGVAISGKAATINATRSLNGDGARGDLPPLTSPPLVTLAPGATSYSVLQWMLYDGQSCYPTGTFEFVATAPNTTNTVDLSQPRVGRDGICSSLVVTPVVPGVYGFPTPAK